MMSDNEKLIAGEVMVEAPEKPVTAKLIEDMPMEDYHAFGNIAKHPADFVLSNSMLCKYIDCPEQFRYEFLTEKQEEEKDYLNIGTAVHTLALEPDQFESRFYVIPEGIRRDKRTEPYKKCMASAGTRIMLPHKDYMNILGMAQKLSAEPYAKALFDGPGYIESSIFYNCPHTGQRLRVRPDWFRKDGKLIINLKTTHSAKPDLFFKTASEFGYDIGAAMQLEAVERLMGPDPNRNYVLLVIEPKPPHIISIFDTIRPMTLNNENDNSSVSYAESGLFRKNKAVYGIRDCLKLNRWPGYQEGVQPMRYPGWVMKKILNDGEA